MDSKSITKSIVGITIASLLIAALVVPVISSAELGQTYNVPTHGKEQAIYNKDFNWWVDYWQKYDCQSAYVDLTEIGGQTGFIIYDVTSSSYYEGVYSPDFDMSYDVGGTWIIQLNATDGVAIGNNYLLSKNAPTKEYVNEVAYNENKVVDVMVTWSCQDPFYLRLPATTEITSYDLLISEGTDIGDGYYLAKHHTELSTGNYEDYYYNVNNIEKVTIGGDPTIRTLLFIIPVLMLAGLVITVALSLRVQRD